MFFRNLAKDTAVYGGADLVTKLIAFFTFPLIAAALSPRAFGALELIVTLIGLFSLLVNCGLNNAIQRFYWDKDVPVFARPVIVSTGLSLQIFFAALFIVLISLLMPMIWGVVAPLNMPFTIYGLFAAVILLAVTQATQYIQDVIRLHFKPFNFLLYTLLGRVLVAFSAVFAVLYLKAGVDGILIAQAFVGLVVFPLGIYLIRKDLTLKLSREWAGTLVKFGHPFIFAGLAYWLFGAMDRWMLASMSSVEEVGIYSVSYRFASIVMFASAAFGQAWSPHAIKIKSDHPEMYRKIYADLLLFLLYCMLIIGGGTALFSGEIISTIMPGEYAASAIPLTILAFGIVFQSTQQITAIGISLEKRTGLLMRMAWITAIINFIGNYLLIPHMGAAGASWATLISYIVLTSGYLYLSQKLHPIPIPWGKLMILLGLAFSVLVAGIIFNTNQISLPLIAAKVLLALTCMGIGFLLLPIKEMKNVVQT